MRTVLAMSTLLLLGACVSRPQPLPLPPQQLPPPSPQTRGPIIGMTTEALVRRLGTPALQIREGQSLKLQFRSHYCVLDAYLYPPPGAAAPYRVSYVDARNRALANVDQAACIASLGAP